MNSVGKPNIRNGAGFTDRLRTLCRFLFGSPYGPPLNRKDFFREALIVFFVRLPVANFLAWVFYLESQRPDHLLEILTIPAALIFYCPYFFAMHRRLAYLACTRPTLVTWAAVLCLTACNVLLVAFFGEADLLSALLSGMLHIAVYLPLLFIPERCSGGNTTLTSS